MKSLWPLQQLYKQQLDFMKYVLQEVKSPQEQQKSTITSSHAIAWANPPYGKRWQLYILPQYLANPTQAKGTYFLQK